MSRSSIPAALAATLLALPAAAVELGDGKLSLNGYGGWAAGFTDGNPYGIGHEDGHFENESFALVFNARPAPNVLVSGNTAWAEHTLAVDWAFVEYRFHDLFRLRAGKVKQPLGSYMELQDVGTARPFFELPRSVYGPANLGAEAYVGVGVAGEWLGDFGWNFGWDGYAGTLELRAYEPFDVLRPDFDPEEGIGAELEHLDRIVGGRVSVEAPFGLTLRLSGYGAETEKDDAEGEALFYVAGASAEYDAGPFELRAELFRSVEDGGESALSGYAQAAYRLGARWQLAARYERSRTDVEGFDGSSPLLRHDAAAVGLNWWVTPQLVFRASYHAVWGTRFVLLDEVDEEDVGGSPLDLRERTQLFVVGTHFSF